MKQSIFLNFFYFISAAFFIVSCSKEENTTTLINLSKTYEDLYAPQSGGRGEPISGEFTKFDLSTGHITADPEGWDIAFRGTAIAINGGSPTGTLDEPPRNGNGGATFVSGTFESVTVAPSNFSEDSSEGFAIPGGSGNGWYNYNPQMRMITPIPGKILVVRTRDGKYAKIEILSYYKGAPANPNPMADASRYYTFRFLYNPNEGSNSLE